ncbi:MAG TPA: DUF664 domain-containing protein [Gemmatimonadales bacterium]
MLAETFLEESRRFLRGDYLPKILICLEILPPADLWWRANAASNSVGNLVLHLAGNARQWLVHGVGGAPDVRRRQAEFDRREGIPAAELATLLRDTLFEADAVLARLTPAMLIEPRRIQGLDTTVLGAVYHVVEHFSTHTGQIVLLTKLRTGRDLGFWEARADGTVIRRWQPL